MSAPFSFWAGLSGRLLGVEGVLHRIRILVVVVEEGLLRAQVAVEEERQTWVVAVEAVQHLQPSEEE